MQQAVRREDALRVIFVDVELLLGQLSVVVGHVRRDEPILRVEDGERRAHSVRIPYGCSVRELSHIERLARSGDERGARATEDELLPLRLLARVLVDDFGVLGVDHDAATLLELPEEELFAERRLHLLLNHASEGTRAEVRIVPLVGEVHARIVGHLATDAVSIGPYVLSGGELPAMVLLDAIARRLPGALSEGSGEHESFSAALDGGLEYPHYTRPAEYRGWGVPDVLLSGDHAMIERWRSEQSSARSLA